MLLLIDNYDSFTYNLVHYFQFLQQDVRVVQHDKITLDEIDALNPSHIVISPGPNTPDEAGISVEIINNFYQKTPILGICLGHQCLGYAFGARIVTAKEIVHGKTSAIYHHKQGLFQTLPRPFLAMRYHSLMIEPASLPASFSIDAWADETIMAISHRHYPLFGLQFHPESILTEHGLHLLTQFLKS